DSNGNLMWQKVYGSYNIYEAFKTIFKASDSGFYFLGGYKYTSDYQSHNWLMKIDANGNEQWNKLFGEDSLAASAFVRGLIANDNNIVFVGDQYHLNKPAYGVLMKVSQEGDSIWSHLYHFPNENYPDYFYDFQ